MARRKLPPLIDPAHVQDAFASGFVVQDWDDWVRIVGFADDVDYANGAGGNGKDASVRRKSAAMIVPRSGLRALIDALQQSAGAREPSRRHS